MRGGGEITWCTLKIRFDVGKARDVLKQLRHNCQAQVRVQVQCQCQDPPMSKSKDFGFPEIRNAGKLLAYIFIQAENKDKPTGFL